MAKAMTMLQGLGQKVSGKEHQDCRTLQVNMPLPSTVDVEFNKITFTVSAGLTSRSKFKNGITTDVRFLKDGTVLLLI